MPLEWIHSSDHVDWDELSQLYLDAPLGYKAPADLKVAFSNSMFKCLVYDDGKLIAAGRALADGTDCSYIRDVAVHPKYQRLGLGRDIVSKLVEFSKNHKKIILYPAVGHGVIYPTLELVNRAGEAAGRIKKIFRDKNGIIGEAER
jgi:GNAT superfamily N-acetyltransferase